MAAHDGSSDHLIDDKDVEVEIASRAEPSPGEVHGEKSVNPFTVDQDADREGCSAGRDLTSSNSASASLNQPAINTPSTSVSEPSSKQSQACTLSV